MAWNVLIIGGGFAGSAVARHLEKELPRQAARVSLINDVNFSLYTPFLPEAAAGTLEPRHVVTPLREVLHRTHLRIGRATEHKPGKILFENGREKEWLHYDRLVLALGSVARVPPIPGLREHAVGFKSLADAIWLRNRVVEQLEAANSEPDPERARQMLSFLFVGGGYAGLEALAELQDFAASAISSYPLARLRGMNWTLVDSADRVLREIDPVLSSYAVSQLRSRGIEVRTGITLQSLDREWAYLSDGTRVPAATTVWTAGVRPHPVLEQFGLPLGERGNVIVDQELRAASNIWALGDCAEVPEPGGGTAPPAAQHALRQARTVSQNLLASIGIGKSSKYSYRSQNAFVNLGRYKAVGRIGPLRFSGPLAWWLARTYHILQIPGLSRKIRSVLDWTVGLPFQRDLAELGTLGKPLPLEESTYQKGGSHKPKDASL